MEGQGEEKRVIALTAAATLGASVSEPATVASSSATGPGGGGGVGHVTFERPVSRLSLAQLVGEITGEVSLLAKKQVELAKAELKSDLKAEVAMVGGLSAAAVAVLTAVNMLFVTAILALAQVMAAWAAGLLVVGALLGLAGLFGLLGWTRRVRQPLAKTRATLREDVRWTRERFA